LLRAVGCLKRADDGVAFALWDDVTRAERCNAAEQLFMRKDCTTAVFDSLANCVFAEPARFVG
jgi:hypothetical protein